MDRKIGSIYSRLSTMFKLNTFLTYDGEGMIKALAELNGVKYEHIFKGQKRIVVDMGPMVIKLVYNQAGLSDNINDILTSCRLSDLAAAGTISQYELSLFAISTAYMMDPFMIVADSVTRLYNSKEFIEWMAAQKSSPEFQTLDAQNEFVVHWLATHPKYSKQQTEIGRVLSVHFVASDVSVFRTPENYGINKNGDLCLLDLGSILPKYRDANVTCKLCGSAKVMSAISLESCNIKDVLSRPFNTYICENTSCPCGGVQLLMENYAENTQDNVVFSEYMLSCSDHSREFLMDSITKARIFIPDKRISDFNEYMSELQHVCNFAISLEDGKNIFINSLPYILRSAVGHAYERIAEFVNSDQAMPLDHNAVTHNIMALIGFESPINHIFASLMFAKIRVRTSNFYSNPAFPTPPGSDGSGYNVFHLLRTEDKSAFLGSCSILSITNIDAQQMYHNLAMILNNNVRQAASYQPEQGGMPNNPNGGYGSY